MTENLIYLLMGVILGVYIGNQNFRSRVNELLKSAMQYMSRLEFKRNYQFKEGKNDKTRPKRR